MPETTHTDEAPEVDASPDLATLATRIEEIVQQIERNDIALEQSVALFEEGVALTRKAQELLDAAEQRVAMLIDEDSAQGD